MTKTSFGSALVLMGAFAVGNHLYQAAQAVANWEGAVDRSFFQAMAILAVWVLWRKPDSPTVKSL